MRYPSDIDFSPCGLGGIASLLALLVSVPILLAQPADTVHSRSSARCGTPIMESGLGGRRLEGQKTVPEGQEYSISGHEDPCDEPGYQLEPHRDRPGLLSVRQLRYPLSDEDRELIESIQQDLKTGARENAMKGLEKALDSLSTQPYVAAILGAEYLRAGQVELAIPELERAARWLPGLEEVHSNLALGLVMGDQLQRAEEEVDAALVLDKTSPQANYLKGVLLLNQEGREEDGVKFLNSAGTVLPEAHLALASYYRRIGASDAAEQQQFEYDRAKRSHDGTAETFP